MTHDLRPGIVPGHAARRAPERALPLGLRVSGPKQPQEFLQVIGL